VRAAQRPRVQRAAHLLAALVLAAYLYVPGGEGLQNTVRFIVLPVLALTGVAMWQAARIQRMRRTAARRRTSRDQAASAVTSEDAPSP